MSELTCRTCDHFRNGCTAPVPFWAEPHGRPRIYREDSGCEVHSNLSSTDLADALAAAAKAVSSPMENVSFETRMEQHGKLFAALAAWKGRK